MQKPEIKLFVVELYQGHLHRRAVDEFGPNRVAGFQPFVEGDRSRVDVLCHRFFDPFPS